MTSPSSEEPIRVMLVDDHEVVRAGLRVLLERRYSFRVVGEAHSVETAIEVARHAAPDVVIMDLRLPDGSGAKACREIRAERPETQVVMLTSFADEESAVNSLMAGAVGYLLKTAQSDTLAEAVRVARAGGSILEPSIAAMVLERMRRGSNVDPTSILTPEERDILERIGRGDTNREIAAAVHLAEKTIKKRISGILDKIGVDNRTAAAAWLMRYTAARD